MGMMRPMGRERDNGLGSSLLRLGIGHDPDQSLFIGHFQIGRLALVSHPFSTTYPSHFPVASSVCRVRFCAVSRQPLAEVHRFSRGPVFPKLLHINDYAVGPTQERVLFGRDDCAGWRDCFTGDSGFGTVGYAANATD